MDLDDRQREFRELERLVARVQGRQPAFILSWRSLRRRLAYLAAASWAEHDAWLLRALGDGSKAPGPLAACLLAWRLGTLAELAPEICLDLAEAGCHSWADAALLAQERLRRADGGALRIEVLRLLQCRGERLDGTGPLGLAGGELDLPIQLFAAACAYLEGAGLPGGGLCALAAITFRSTLFGKEATQRLLQAVSAVPLGSYVRLNSGESGRVVGVQPKEPLRPVVRVRFPTDGGLAQSTSWGPSRVGPTVAEFLEAPWADAPKSGESAEAWLVRVDRGAATAAKHPRPLLPAYLTSGWDEEPAPAPPEAAEPPADRPSEPARPPAPLAAVVVAEPQAPPQVENFEDAAQSALERLSANVVDELRGFLAAKVAPGGVPADFGGAHPVPQVPAAPVLERSPAEAERGALEKARDLAALERERWLEEQRTLQAAILEKRNRLEELRRQNLETAQGKDAELAEAQRSLSAFEQQTAGRLVEARTALNARKAALDGALAALKSETKEAAGQRTETMAAFQERRVALEAEIQRLRGEWGDLKGMVAAQQAEEAPLRHALKQALSELDLRLIEATFALDTTRKEAVALSSEQERRLSEWQRAGAELEAMSADFSRLSGLSEPLLEQWRELAGNGLAGVSAVFREQILARARELGLWTDHLARVARRLAASRSALESAVLVRCRETGLRAFREGRLDDARANLRQALALKDDPELRALLARLELGPANPSPIRRPAP